MNTLESLNQPEKPGFSRISIWCLSLLGICAPAWNQAAPVTGPEMLLEGPALTAYAVGIEPFNTDVEPPISPAQSTILQPVLELMRDEPEAAINELEFILENEAMVLGETEGITENTLSAVFEFTLANLYFQEERFDQALKWYGRAIEKFPQFRRAYKNSALIHAQKGDLEKVIKPLTRSIILGERSGSLYGLLAACLLRDKEIMAAEAAYREALLLEPNKLDFKLGLSRSIFEQGRYEEAIALSRDLIRLFPERTDFWILQSNAYLALGQTRRAAENYEILYRMEKATSRSMNLLADIYVNNKQFPLAAYSYIRAFEIDEEKGVQAPLRGAQVLVARGALNEAKQVLETVKETAGDSMAKKDLRELLKTESRIAIAQGAGMEVIKVLKELIEEDPEDGDSMLQLGRQYTQMSEFEKARELYESAAQLEEYEQDAKIKLGTMLVRQSQFVDLEKAVSILKESIDILQGVLKQDPQDRLIDYLEKIQTIYASKEKKLQLLRAQEEKEARKAEETAESDNVAGI